MPLSARMVSARCWLTPLGICQPANSLISTKRSPRQDRADDIEAVVVTVVPSDDFDPARLTISAKFQCGWYQYVHSWEFDSDGVIHPRVAMGGMLNPFPIGHPQYKSHVHNFYFRIDLDID